MGIKRQFLGQSTNDLWDDFHDHHWNGEERVYRCPRSIFKNKTGKIRLVRNISYLIKKIDLMFEKLFPKTIDNQYRGMSIAKWVFVAMTVLTIARSLAHIFLPDGGAQSIATIPLDDYTSNGARVIIGMFAQWGLTQLMVGLLYVIVLWRYQSLIPLMWLFILFEWAGRLLSGIYKPFETVGTAPGAIGNLIFPVLALVMLVLALKERKDV